MYCTPPFFSPSGNAINAPDQDLLGGRRPDGVLRERVRRSQLPHLLRVRFAHPTPPVFLPLFFFCFVSRFFFFFNQPVVPVRFPLRPPLFAYLILRCFFADKRNKRPSFGLVC